MGILIASVRLIVSSLLMPFLEAKLVPRLTSLYFHIWLDHCLASDCMGVLGDPHPATLSS